MHEEAMGPVSAAASWLLYQVASAGHSSSPIHETLLLRSHWSAASWSAPVPEHRRVHCVQGLAITPNSEEPSGIPGLQASRPFPLQQQLCCCCARCSADRSPVAVAPSHPHGRCIMWT